MTTYPLTRRKTLALTALGGVSLALPLAAQDSDGVRDVVEMTMGAEDAPVTVVEYASFTCPHCKRFHEDVFPQIREEFVDSGKVRFILREVYFDRYGLWAGMVARCGGEMRYFGIVDLIFKKQSEWTQGADAVAVSENLYSIGRQAGLSNDDIAACMADQDWAKALVETYQKNADADNLTGTPMFLVNGEKHGNMGYAQFAEILNAALAD